MKRDLDKPRTDLLPWDALLPIADALRLGAIEHGEETWRTLPDGVPRYVAAALRHLAAHIIGGGLRGRLPRNDTGLPHIVHAGCDVLFAIALCLSPSPSNESDSP